MAKARTPHAIWQRVALAYAADFIARHFQQSKT
jgi:hypothetical protein